MATVVFALAVCCREAAANTVAWYHFEDAANGAQASYSVPITNSVDAAVLPARTRWINGTTVSDANGAAYMPTYENVLPEGVSWSGGSLAGTRRTGLHLNMMSGASTWGTGSAMGFLQVADDAESPRLKLQTFTIEFFMKFDPKFTPTGDSFLLTMRAASSSATPFRFLVNSAKKVNYRFRKSDGTYTDLALSDVTTLLDGNLHHVAFVKTASSFQIFVDYVRKVNDTTAAVGGCEIGYVDGANILEVGLNSTSDYGRLPCWIDELRISDTALASSSFVGFRERLDNDSMLEADTIVYHDFDAKHTSLNGTTVFNNLATAENAPTLSLHTPSGGRAPTFVSDDLYASNLWFAACDKVANLGCWDFQYGDTAGVSSILSIDDTKHSGGASHRIYDGDSTVEMWVRFPEAPARTEMLWNSEFGTSSHIVIGTRIYALSNGNVYFSLVSQVQADAHLESGNPDRVERAVTGGATDGNWHHVALVNDRSHGKVRCYWDRKLVGNEYSGYLATNAYPAISSRSPIRISGQGTMTPTDNDKVQFKGRIDMLRVTARALAPNEFVRAWKEKRGTLVLVF